MKPNTTLITIPALSDSTVLAKWQTPGEPVVIVKMTVVGNNQPYTHRADDKSFIFRWSTDQQGHVLRVPLSLWMQNKAKLAHQLMDQRRATHALIVLFEMPAVAAVFTEPAESFTSPEMGAADTTPAQNVVGLSEEPTAAPAEDWSKVPSDDPSRDGTPVDDEGKDANEDATATAEITQDAEDQIPEASLEQRIYEAVYEKPKRLNELAASLGVMGDSLRNSIARPESRVELAAAGWVRRKESQPA